MLRENSNLYERMTMVIEHLVASAKTHPSLEDLANVACMSESHFQRTFHEWAGVTPKQFIQTIHRTHAKRLLTGMPVSEASGLLGYSSESRLYDNFVRFESMTPGEYKSGGAALEIGYGLSESPFGHALIAWTSRGLVKLAFLHQGLGVDGAVEELVAEWPRATLSRDDAGAGAYASEIFVDRFNKGVSSNDGTNASLKVCVKGTAFQVKVWEALLAIPEGEVCSYQALAASSGMPESVRAVASAIAKNPIAYLIPCHRVIRSSGAVNQYRWGDERKIAMLMKEVGKGVESSQA
jgi:AraC family transcriptional regulator of adaptative response/methylated-DNA-[protein]-cysteine methyltransferase